MSLTVSGCGIYGAHHFGHLHQFVVLLVQLFVLDIQHYLEALQFLFQIQGVGVLLEQNKKRVSNTVLHQFVVLFMQLFVLDIQHHTEALQLLLQIQGVLLEKGGLNECNNSR